MYVNMCFVLLITAQNMGLTITYLPLLLHLHVYMWILNKITESFFCVKCLILFLINGDGVLNTRQSILGAYCTQQICNNSIIIYICLFTLSIISLHINYLIFFLSFSRNRIHKNSRPTSGWMGKPKCLHCFTMGSYNGCDVKRCMLQ